MGLLRLVPGLPGPATRGNRPTGRSAIALGVSIVLVGMAPPAASSPFTDDFSGYRAGERWGEGSAHGVWTVRYNGFGSVGVLCPIRGALELRPAAAVAPEQTHAALVVTRMPYRDGVLRLSVRTVRQLRENGPPNPWEVAWIVFRYSDDEHFYYLALKTNGWELGKRDPTYPGGQRFLGTGSAPESRVGEWSRVSIVMQAGVLSVQIDGTPVVTTIDMERPLLAGAIGMYAEDAEVEFDDISFVGT